MMTLLACPRFSVNNWKHWNRFRVLVYKCTGYSSVSFQSQSETMLVSVSKYLKFRLQITTLIAFCWQGIEWCYLRGDGITYSFSSSCVQHYYLSLACLSPAAVVSRNEQSAWSWQLQPHGLGGTAATRTGAHLLVHFLLLLACVMYRGGNISMVSAIAKAIQSSV